MQNLQYRAGYYADVRTEDRFTTEIRVLNGVPQEARERTELRAFVRVFDGGMWYYASTTDLSHLQQTLDQLYAVATANPQIENHPLVRQLERNRDRVMTFEQNSVRQVPFADKQALVQQALPLLAADPCMTMPGARYLDRHSLFSFSSSLGAEITYDYQLCGMILSCDMVEGERKFSARWQCGKTDFAELTAALQQAEASLAEQAVFMRTSVPVEAGDYPVVLSPVAAGVFAHESFGHKSESDFMLSDEGMKKEWELGKTVGSPILSICECGSLPGAGYTPYDDEGTRARKNDLIRGGILAGRLHSAQTAAALGEAVTGNARAVNCTFEPIVRMTNTYIEGGDATLEELIAPIEKGYFIKEISHGSGMSTFTIAPTLAYEIVNGKVGRPVQISVISGSVFETLGLIDGLSREVEMLSFVSGGCGKLEQYPLPVGFGGPYVRVSRMHVQ